MGIHGVFKQIGPGTRISLAKLSTQHLESHGRPLRIAVDISIWLFQIQSGKGGSNPALRTFYYRLLRLLSLNIHPLFVFDGPNKPLFKRNKKVGGPGVRVASVPEFLAKQLLKEFGFPWHVAPGEAEAECALLQTVGIVDAVLSEDVDTLMFGSGVLIRNWSPEDKGTTPTHVNIYDAQEVKTGSGMDKEGMILVALMSGGDYLPEGIPGCGPKTACDAARAGFGIDLCKLNRKDTIGVQAWKDRLQEQIQTNKDKYFTRKHPSFQMPDDFPNLEVLGYYTHPCVSSDEKIQRLRNGLRWDQAIDFDALRLFTADAFDWRCLSGAKKFIRNLAPAMLVRQLRLRAPEGSVGATTNEASIIQAIHGKRNHKSTDGLLEFRISIIPQNFVPIDLSLEDEDDDFRSTGGLEIDEEVEENALPDTESDAPSSPSKLPRQMRPYDPAESEKLWITRDFLLLGCPEAVRTYENGIKTSRKPKSQPTKATKKQANALSQNNSIMDYGNVTKAARPRPLKELSPRANAKSGTATTDSLNGSVPKAGLKLPSARNVPPSSAPSISSRSLTKALNPSLTQVDAITSSQTQEPSEVRVSTPHKKRTSAEMASTPATQRSIRSFFTPSPQKSTRQEVIILSSSPVPITAKASKVPAPNVIQDAVVIADDQTTPGANLPLVFELPDSVQQRRKRAPLRRHRTLPIESHDSALSKAPAVTAKPILSDGSGIIEVLDLCVSSPAQHDIRLPVRDEPNALSEVPSGRHTIRSDTLISTAQNSIRQSTHLDVAVDVSRRSPRIEKLQRKKVVARQSLQGAWKAVDEDTLTPGTQTWALDSIDILDLS